MSVTTDTLLAQEQNLQFDSFTNADALSIGLIIIDIAINECSKGIALHIETDTYPLFTHYMQGTSENNSYWIRTKKSVVMKFGHSSLFIGESYKEKGTTFKESTGLSTDDYQVEGGSFPLIVRGTGRIGTITVSGLTGEEDHALAVRGLEEYIKKNKGN